MMKYKNKKIVFTNNSIKIERHVEIGQERIYWLGLFPFLGWALIIYYAVKFKHFKTYIILLVFSTFIANIIIYFIVATGQAKEHAEIIYFAIYNIKLFYIIYRLIKIGNYRQIKWCLNNGYVTDDLSIEEQKNILEMNTFSLF